MLKTKKQLIEDTYDLAMIAAHCQHMEDELQLKYFRSYSETTREFLKRKRQEGVPLYTLLVLLKEREKTLEKAYNNIFSAYVIDAYGKKTEH